MSGVRSLYNRLAIPVIWIATAGGGTGAYLAFDTSTNLAEKIGMAAAGVATGTTASVLEKRRQAHRQTEKAKAVSQGEGIAIPLPTDGDDLDF